MLVIVPYRDRPEHLEKFLSLMSDYKILVVEQAAGKAFNRGKLINVGFLYSNPECFIAHDVDMIPETLDYIETYGVTQLAGSDIQLVGYLGGVTMYDYSTFIKIGGYHNDYFHRAEDNEMMFNLQRLNIKINYKPKTFINLPHERTGPEFIPHLWIKAQQVRKIQNQLAVCEYNVVSTVFNKNITHIKVEI